MHLVREIVGILSDTNPSLENALIKTKVLLYRLGEKGYTDWINKELNGDSKEDEVPPYRVFSSAVMITATDGFTRRWTDMPAPLSHLDEDVRCDFQRKELRYSISALERFARSEGESLSSPIAPELSRMLGKPLSPGVVVEYAHCQISKAQLQGLLTQIRSRLLDFVLELDSRLPANASEHQVRHVSKEVHVGNLFNNAMFGPNTTIALRACGTPAAG
jgi:AbiTii-like protein